MILPRHHEASTSPLGLGLAIDAAYQYSIDFHKGLILLAC